MKISNLGIISKNKLRDWERNKKKMLKYQKAILIFRMYAFKVKRKKLKLTYIKCETYLKPIFKFMLEYSLKFHV